MTSGAHSMGVAVRWYSRQAPETVPSSYSLASVMFMDADVERG